jgi:hypothetical protein
LAVFYWKGSIFVFSGFWEFCKSDRCHWGKYLQEMMKEHLCALQTSIRDYFPSIPTAGVEWVISPFGTPGEHNINNASDLTFTEKN